MESSPVANTSIHPPVANTVYLPTVNFGRNLNKHLYPIMHLTLKLLVWMLLPCGQKLLWIFFLNCWGTQMCTLLNFLEVLVKIMIFIVPKILWFGCKWMVYHLQILVFHSLSLVHSNLICLQFNLKKCLTNAQLSSV